MHDCEVMLHLLGSQPYCIVLGVSILSPIDLSLETNEHSGFYMARSHSFVLQLQLAVHSAVSQSKSSVWRGVCDMSHHDYTQPES